MVSRIFDNKEDTIFINNFHEEQKKLLILVNNTKSSKRYKIEIIGKIYQIINEKFEHYSKVSKNTFSTNRFAITSYNKSIEILDVIKNLRENINPLLVKSVTKIILKSRKILYRKILKINKFDLLQLPKIMKSTHNYNLRKLKNK
jgi:hypothetical protein